MPAKTDKQPGPGKVECPNCPGQHFKSLPAHLQMKGCGAGPTAEPSSHDAEASAPAAQLPLEGKSMATCDNVDCKLRERDLKDRDQEIEGLKKLAEKPPEAPNLATALAHAQDGACPSCTTTLQEFTQDLVAKAIPALSDEAVRALALERKVIPDTITVEIPARS